MKRKTKGGRRKRLDGRRDGNLGKVRETYQQVRESTKKHQLRKASRPLNLKEEKSEETDGNKMAEENN